MNFSHAFPSDVTRARVREMTGVFTQGMQEYKEWDDLSTDDCLNLLILCGVQSSAFWSYMADNWAALYAGRFGACRETPAGRVPVPRKGTPA